MKAKSRALPAALALAFLFAGGLVLLLQRSYAPGNVYPAYSTLRTDPRGASALFESLQALPGLQVSRGYQALAKSAEKHPGATLVELGGDLEASIMQSPRDYALLEELLASGCRLIILSAPMTENLLAASAREARKDAPTKPAPQPPKEPDISESDAPQLLPFRDNQISLCEKWGFALEFIPVADPAPGSDPSSSGPEQALPAPNSGLNQPLHWSSRLGFRNLHSSWQVLYEKDGRPVLMERTFGNGSIVLATDAYFISNEALRSDRRTDLILRVLGPGAQLVFRETQHGLNENLGLASLLRRYRLHGALACLFLLALLFVWRSVCSLVPPDDSFNPAASTASGLAARDGLAHLLQRNLSPLQALQEGLNRWVKTNGQDLPEDRLTRAQDYLFDLRSRKLFNLRELPRIYKTLQTMMTERK